MLNKVEVRNSRGDLLSLLLEDISNGYAVKNIDGLDPVKATIVKSSFAQLNGTQYHSSSLLDRNIIMKLGLYPDFTTNNISSLRKDLYNYLMPTETIDLRFYDDNGLTVNTSGKVESLETPLFAKDPEVDISIICFDPDFLALTPTLVNGNTVSDTTETLFSYSGTSETGFVFVLNVNRTLTEFTIYNRMPDGTVQTLDFAASLVSGDVVTISTVTGSKGATLTRSGTTTSLLYAIPAQSNWISLKKGNNNIRVHATGAAIPYSITYTARYGGL